MQLCSRLSCRLKDIIYGDKQLYLVFEWVDKDLKKYMDSVAPMGMPAPLIKVIGHTSPPTRPPLLLPRPPSTLCLAGPAPPCARLHVHACMCCV